MTNDGQSHFSVDLVNGTKLDFQSFDNIGNWIAQQRNDWSWLLQGNVQNWGPQLQQLRASYQRAFEQLNHALAQLRQAPSDRNKGQMLQNIFAKTYSTNSNTLLSDHPWAILSGKIATTSGPLAGAAALAYLLKVPVDIGSNFAVGGIVQAILARDGISKDSPDVVSQSLQMVIRDNQAAFDQQMTELQERTNMTDSFLATSKSEFDRQISEHNGKWNEISNNINTTAGAALKSIAATEAAYTKQMQLQASISYWTNQARAQKQNGRFYLTALLIFVVVVMLVGVWAANKYIPLLVGKSIAQEPAAYAVFATVTLLLCTIIFWAARVMIRLWLSAHHLVIDAEERVVMIATYLALIKEGQLDEKERALVLTPLFRSSSDGIVKDEGAPDLSIATLISRFLAGR